MTTPAEQIYSFLRERWPSDLPGWLVLTSGKSRGDFHVRGSYELTEVGLAELAARAVVWSERGENVWCTVNAFGAPPQGKGTAKQVRFVSGLVADVDVKNHPDPVRVITELPPELTPSTIVWSGGGAQPIWLFERPLDLDELTETTGQTVDQLQESVKRLGQLLQAGLERTAGTAFDGVANLDRVMRLPHTTNYKYDPPQPTYITLNLGQRYTGAAIQAALLAAGITQPAAERTFSSGGSADVGDAGQLAPSADKIERMIAQAGDVPNGAQREFLLRLVGSMWSQGYAPSLIEREATRVATELFTFYDPSRPWTHHDVLAMIADTSRKFGQIDRFEVTPEHVGAVPGIVGQTTRYGDHLEEKLNAGSTNGHEPLDVLTPEERRQLVVARQLDKLEPALRAGVVEELKRYDVRTTARRLLDSSVYVEPRGGRLDQLVFTGIPEPDWLFDELQEVGTNTSLTAGFKTGKTTLQLNMVRSLVDREPFLGRFEPRELCGNVAFFNYELTDAQFVRWAAEMQIVHMERIWVQNVRGLRQDLGDDYTRERTIEWLRERDIEYWIIDPFARAYHGDENSNTEVKFWTENVDVIKYESGVSGAQISLHTGRGEQEEGTEHGRGATRMDDWVDGRMILTRQGQHRYFRAEGRDVDVPETLLSYDAEHRRFEVSNLGSVNRRTHETLEGVEHVLGALRELGALTRDAAVTRTQLRNAIRTGKLQSRDRWITSAVQTGGAVEDRGQRSGTILWITPDDGVVGDPLTPEQKMEWM